MRPEIIRSVEAMQETSSSLRQMGHTIGFVPTMGYLHEGHLRLVEVAREHCSKVVVSIFVNPTQFGPKEDFNRYPRDPEGDIQKLRKKDVDLVFMPEAHDMYPQGFQTVVSVKELTKGLCGASRPGHFRARQHHCAAGYRGPAIFNVFGWP
jgi:pantoate--beta-alanine ligase